MFFYYYFSFVCICIIFLINFLYFDYQLLLNLYISRPLNLLTKWRRETLKVNLLKRGIIRLSQLVCSLVKCLAFRLELLESLKLFSL